MNNHEVIDDFLDKRAFESIQKIIMGSDFHWFFQDKVTPFNKDRIKDVRNKYEFFWGHVFFRSNEGITSPFFKNLAPLLNKLKVKALIRIRANLFSNQGKIIEHEYHSDFTFENKTALFSLNTCNGYTALYDGTKIKSIANRILLFDSSMPHSTSTCTDAKIRCNININYF